MKLWSKFFVSLLAVAAMAGCNKHTESFDKDLGFVDDGEPLYMSLNLQLPVGMPGTRTATDKTTTEDGISSENTVQTVLLVLAEDGTDNYIAHTLTGRIASSANGRLTVTSPIDKTALGRYYTNNRKEGEKGDEMTLADGKDLIRVYAYCNPPQDLLKAFAGIGELVGKETAFTNEWLHYACEIGQNNPLDNRTETGKEEGAVDAENQSVWADHSFLMSNMSIYVGKLPQTYSTWEEHATAANPFVIKKTTDNDIPSAISVERAVARFDFKDGSPGDNTYDVTTTGAASGKLQVKLVRMSLVNMSRHFYYLKHVTNGVNYGDSAVVCIPETMDNWVVDTDWKENHKSATRDENFKLNLSEIKKFYNFCLFDPESGKITETTRAAWNNHRVENVLKQQAAGGGDDYHIWRYVTENTIPNVQHQTNGISTGIVFKGKLLATGTGDGAVNKDLWAAINGEYVMNTDTETGKPIGYTYQLDARDEEGKPILNEDGTVKKLTYPILYMFNDVLYVGWNHQIKPLLDDPKNAGTPLVEAAKTEYFHDGRSVHDLYQEVVKIHNGDMNGDLQTALDNFRAAATDAGFTLYQASDDVTQGDDKGFGPGYYFYYYYWNRHNDNGRAGTMGKMEFGVVRNNIYKLSVKSIKNLGHPRITDNDPEKPTPETPNEDAKVYMEVNVEVRPWTVRVNEIEF